MIKSVVFDVGETLLDDTREFHAWADWLDVPRHTLSALVGIVVAQGRNNSEAFEYVRPGIDLAAERERREAAGLGEQIEDGDLYPDVRPALAQLHELGLWIGIAGNQTIKAADLIRRLKLPVDDVATSGEWGVAKPDAQFFDRVVDFANGERGEILYVGDHRDYDVKAASDAGLKAALLKRGPWGRLWAQDRVVRERATWVIDSLVQLPALLRRS